MDEFADIHFDAAAEKVERNPPAENDLELRQLRAELEHVKVALNEATHAIREREHHLAEFKQMQDEIYRRLTDIETAEDSSDLGIGIAESTYDDDLLHHDSAEASDEAPQPIGRAADVTPGTAAPYSREDHVHGVISAQTPQDVADVSAAGNGDHVSDDEHVHGCSQYATDAYDPTDPSKGGDDDDGGTPIGDSIIIRGSSGSGYLPPGSPPAVLCLQSDGIEWVNVDTAYKGVYSDGTDMISDWVRAHA